MRFCNRICPNSSFRFLRRNSMPIACCRNLSFQVTCSRGKQMSRSFQCFWGEKPFSVRGIRRMHIAPLFDYNGSHVFSVPGSAVAGCIVVVHCSGSGNGQPAVVINKASGSGYCRTCRRIAAKQLSAALSNLTKMYVIYTASADTDVGAATQTYAAVRSDSMRQSVFAFIDFALSGGIPKHIMIEL